MVSYFVPRGRFLIKAGNLRQAALQKHQQQQQGKWPVLRHFRQTFSSEAQKSRQTVGTSSTQTDVKVTDTIVRNSNNTFGKHQHKNFTNGKILNSSQTNQQERRSTWMKWTVFLLRWSPVGICLFGVIEWHLHKKKCQKQQIPRTASSFQSKVYCSLPLRIISRCWGWLAACYVPIHLRPYVYGWYSNVFNVNLEEALHPDYKYYNSLAEFFTRPLREDARIINQHAPLVSPADGKVLHFGSATHSWIEQVKGVNYSVESFLGPPTVTGAANEEYAKCIKEKHDDSTALYQCVIYLAPGDYHRFHSPAEWHPTMRRHFAGELLSVNPRVATWLPGLFCLNERAVYMGKWKYGFFSYTAVGATNVGSVQIYMDEKLKTNRWVGLNVGAHKKRHEFDELSLNNNVTLNRGELMGQFNMGSTIVLLFEAPKNFEFNIEAGQQVRVGEPLGHISINKEENI